MPSLGLVSYPPYRQMFLAVADNNADSVPTFSKEDFNSFSLVESLIVSSLSSGTVYQALVWT